MLRKIPEFPEIIARAIGTAVGWVVLHVAVWYVGFCLPAAFEEAAVLLPLHPILFWFMVDWAAAPTAEAIALIVGCMVFPIMVVIPPLYIETVRVRLICAVFDFIAALFTGWLAARLVFDY